MLSIACKTNSRCFVVHAGTLPASWGEVGWFPSLSVLRLVDVPITGSLPSVWGSKAAFPALVDLELNYTRLSGSLPTEWGSLGGFQGLQTLQIDSYNISGDFSGQLEASQVLYNLQMRQPCHDALQPFSLFLICLSHD